MNPRMTVVLAVRSILRNPMRSFLTMLGIVIGVAAVITMLAIGQGAKNSISGRIAGMGTNVISVMPGSSGHGGAHQEAGTVAKFTEADARAIKAEAQSLLYVSPTVRTGRQVKAQGQNCRTQITGAWPEYLGIRDWTLSSGAPFGESEERGAAKVCILGSTVTDNLFGDGADPVGQIIRIGNLPFRVVGVLVQKGQGGMGQDQDDIVITPFSTALKKIAGPDAPVMITASAISENSVDAAKDEIRTVLTVRRPNGGGEGVDYSIRTQTDMAQMAGQVAGTLSMLLAGIACVSLIVGGIGIMNIMLVSVTERTREIGIRMAVGAKGRDVLMQFIVEAVVLSLGGGLLGIILGGAASYIVSTVQGWPVAVSPMSIGLGFGFSAAIGIFFGWYPAQKAAGLNPIDALRSE